MDVKRVNKIVTKDNRIFTLDHLFSSAKSLFYIKLI